MIKNYLKLAARNIKKRKGFSIINITGLGVGIASCVLILIWVQDQLSYDRFHLNSDRLYRVHFFNNDSEVTPPALAVYLKTENPQMAYTSRFKQASRTLVRYGDKTYLENHGAFVDPEFFNMFSLNYISGDPLQKDFQITSVVLTESFARKYFSQENPLGKSLNIYGLDLKITGVIKDYPTNSHFYFKFLMPMDLIKRLGGKLDDWKNNWLQTYVQLQPGADLGTVNKQIAPLVGQFDPTELRTLALRPITSLHLYMLHGGGRITIVRIFSIIAVFILLIACINFINLSTTQSSLRMKEVGMRKTIGARKKELVFQFFTETFLMIFIAWCVAFILLGIFLPEFNMLVGKFFTFKSLLSWQVIWGILGLILITGLLAGSYPSFVLSSFKPVDSLRGQPIRGTGGALVRKGLVIFQFILSVGLIFGTLVLQTQLKFLQNAPLGFDKDHVVTMQIGNRIKSREAFKNKLKNHSNILGITTTDIPPYRWNTNAGYGDVHWQDQENNKVRMVETSVDYDYAKIFGLKMDKGRFFSNKHTTDATKAWVINETAVRAMGMKSPVGKWLKMWDDKRIIIGVVKDFHYETLRHKIMPQAMKISLNNFWACIRIKNYRIPATISFLKDQWKVLAPGYPFEYQFLDEQIARLYTSENRIGSLFKYFSIMAIIISCLGLFGLASFFARRKTKEIGIRKVLGSSIHHLLFLLSKNFIRWVFYGMLIAWPLAWYFMNKILQTYAYQIKIDLSFCFISGGLALLIALVTISWQTFKAARRNPVDSLRYE